MLDIPVRRGIMTFLFYLHTTAEDMRRAAAMHPVEGLVDYVSDLLPNVKVPFQWPPGEKVVPHR
jgi:hypothetical protein